MIFIEENDNGEFVIHVDRLSEEMGVPELRMELSQVQLAVAGMSQSLTSLQNNLVQMLDYMNAIDLRIQQLNGEPVVTVTKKPHLVGEQLSFKTSFPSVPADIAKPPKKGMEQMVTGVDDRQGAIRTIHE
jgi:TolA-binding protein